MCSPRLPPFHPRLDGFPRENPFGRHLDLLVRHHAMQYAQNMTENNYICCLHHHRLRLAIQWLVTGSRRAPLLRDRQHSGSTCSHAHHGGALEILLAGLLRTARVDSSTRNEHISTPDYLHRHLPARRRERLSHSRKTSPSSHIHEIQCAPLLIHGLSTAPSSLFCPPVLPYIT